MVMDMFYSYVETEKKKRVHFHGFMLDVHKSELSQGLNRACMIFFFHLFLNCYLMAEVSCYYRIKHCIHRAVLLLIFSTIQYIILILFSGHLKVCCSLF